tara:strand:- start:367 stop:2004 length:1638 start_codon:yes stop_codon:yes gene_type:complete
MSNSFFRASPEVAVSQYNTRIPSVNGLSYRANQEIICFIDPTIAYFNPMETYLKLNVSINSDMNTQLYLNPIIGGQVLINRVRIVSGTGVELEFIQNYNTYVNLKYTYEKNPELENKRILLEGATTTSNAIKTPIDQSGGGIIASGRARDVENSAFGNSRQAELTLPLHTGIFGNSKLFPNGYTQGLYIYLLLEPDYRCIQQNPAVNVHHKDELLRFQCVGGVDPTTNKAWDAGTTSNQFYVKPNINTNTANLADFPFKVNEKIAFRKAGNFDPIPFKDIDFMTIESIDVDGTYENFFIITIDNPYDPDVADNNLTENDYIVSVETDFGTPPAPTYTINKCDLMVGVVVPPSSYQASFNQRLLDPATGDLSYDFTSVQTYEQSLPSNNNAGTMVLPLNNTMCKALLAVPVLSDRPTWQVALGTEFFVGQYDNLDDYQFFYKNTYQPDRPVNTTQIKVDSVSQQQLIELEKALYQSDISPEYFLKFRENFCIGRAVALSGQVCNLNNQDVQLNVRYTDQTKNKVFNFFVVHVRDIEFLGGGITVQV